MLKSAAWKIAILDALSKFNIAVQACPNSDDTSGIKDYARTFVKLIRDVVFPDETPQTKASDPQENLTENSNST